jgi:uncharacterized protein
MSTRKHDPRKLDIAAWAAEAQPLAGEIDASALPRWHEMQSPRGDEPSLPLRWSARGEQRQRSGEPPQTWLHLRVSAQAWPVCQRCLQPFAVPLEVDQSVRFVDSEAQAQALDADSEDDMLALSASFDLIDLIEDELLLAWPLVPRHAHCQQPAHDAGDAAGAAGPQAAASPFAALAALKARRPGP